jgi:CheY-like chemotaxis protein
MRTVLVVEDDPGVRRVIRAMLQGMGLSIREATDGVQALAAVSASRPDVMILDLVMPEMNGLVLLDELRSAHLVDDVPIVVITGSITPESVIREKGARGVLRKPFTRTELCAAVETVMRRGSLNRERPDSEVRRSRRTPCILIVEDDPDHRQLLETMLRLDGYETMTAANGADALDCMRTRRPCTVLLDLMMPRMDGWQFRRRQLEDPAFAAVPVVCMTGVANPEEVEMQLGVPCLRKPLDVDALLTEIEHHCQPPLR